ncbi:PREDICTED: myotubularin-related protein 14 [Atta colombica]|uniref:myotubularin-related protein 14 n=1 Tax=Atta colombica TaxID=520822 RepID=UPI00084BF200|nr:PREDICTED: myotubularin-related protein 14 [Atta colombica]XP_018045000.1 PREDICTED: myotubularin-related protein 14 [Atta colombica]
MTEISIDSLRNLITHFAKNTYRTKDADVTNQEIMQRCMLLAAFDYEYSTIDNSGGDLCAHYPSYLIILEHDKYRNLKNCDTSLASPYVLENMLIKRNKLIKLMTRSRFARCRSRFPVPVILYKGRHVCRSSTLSSGPEVFGRAGLDFLLSSVGSTSSVQPVTQVEENLPKEESKLTDLKDKVRYYDIELLKTLNVGTIVDFMVEKKKVKYGMTVTSSEKVDQGRRYSDFNLISLPYPGCEFFKEFRDQDYRSKDLVFNWCQNYIDAPICVPEDPISSQLRVNWNQYTEWNLVKLTQNYLKLILRYLSDSNNGLLIHCISGWDRTPLFISLLRISLWADGVIHTTLDSYQLLYYTIAYDWMLFGHDLADRLNKGEEILFFCFDFLKYIENEQFSIHKHYDRTSKHSESETFVIDSESFEIITNSSFSPKNSSSSSIEQNSVDGDSSAAVFFTDSTDNQDDSRNNVNAAHGTFTTSPNKDSGAVQESRSSLSANRTSPIGVPIPRNPHVRQRNDSTSSGDSWQLVTGTGSLCGSTTANAPHLDNVLAPDSDCKPSCTTCRRTRRTSQERNINDDENCVTHTQRRERLHCLRNIFYKAYGPHGFRLKDESGGISQYIGNIVGMTSIQRTS